MKKNFNPNYFGAPELEKKYNENHGPDGRFTSGDGGGGASAASQTPSTGRVAAPTLSSNKDRAAEQLHSFIHSAPTADEKHARAERVAKAINSRTRGGISTKIAALNFATMTDPSAIKMHLRSIHPSNYHDMMKFY